MENDSRKEVEAKMTGEKRTMKIRGEEVVYWVTPWKPITKEEEDSICHRIEKPHDYEPPTNSDTEFKN